MKIVIIGAVAAGATAATNIRKISKDSEIILLEKGRDTSFKNCEIPYYLSEMVKDSKDLIARNPEAFKKKNDIDARNFNEAISIDRDKKEVLVKDIKNDKTYTESYDKLIISTGASPFIPDSIKGLDKDRENVFKVENVVDVENIRAYIKEKNAKKIIVNGAGFIGIEAAENLNELDGVDIYLIVRSRVLEANIDEELAGFVEENIRKHINMIKNDEIIKVEDDELLLKSGKKLDYDVLINAIGIKPNSEIAKKAGLKLTESGAIDTDRNFLTNDPDIYAIGDVIEVYNPLTRKNSKLNLAWPAHREAKFVAKHIFNMAGKSPSFIGSFSLRSFDMNIASTGLSRKVLESENIAFESTLIRHNDSVDILPYSKPMNMKILFDSHTGLIYGIQAVGEGDVVKRVDIVAGLVGMGADIYDLYDTELSYQPIFSTPEDALNTLASQAIDIFEGDLKHVNLYELKDKINDFRIIDIRSKEAFDKSHIRGAENIESSKIKENLDLINKDEKTLLYCNSSNIAKSLTKFLISQGFNKVYMLEGSMVFLEKYVDVLGLDLLER
ncbi:FAD-dependent oxidoreductase [Anaerococcus sp. AGMB00486]|uniref:FAD-dependent oxidoreductase n=1 Tax=Anaerococcus faecalis TaxID=2742993 RepID=A0ABX2N933_9FIRM|nr:FAD-dependent oxidoreductase [Anaerococcus faecalis]NVF11193.1 FAD-dependent oxidoreductase [Anaerococcus faecalis]